MDDPHLSSKTGTSFFRTCFNGVNILAGFGILSIPYAVSEGGWLSLILLFLTAIVCFYTGLVLKRCMDANSLVKTYPDIGELAFGSKGKIIVAIFMYLELYLAAIDFLILEGDNLDKLFPRAKFNIATLKIGGRQGFVLLATLIILPTTWLRSLGVVAYVSFGGVLASLIVVGSVVWTGAFGGVGFHEKSSTDLMNWKGIPTAASLYAFYFSGHSVFPTLYTSMGDKTKFPKVLLICFSICTLNYAVMGVMGYLMYGSHVKSQITLNLPAGKICSKIAIYTTLINPLTKYALLITPIANTIEDYFQVSKSRLISIAIRTLLVVSTVIAALTVPFFAFVMALTGSFLSSTSTMLLPCVCYIKIFKSYRRWSFELVAMVMIMLMGGSIAVIGTYTSLLQIIHNM